MSEKTGLLINKDLPFEHFMDMLKEKGIKTADSEI